MSASYYLSKTPSSLERKTIFIILKCFWFMPCWVFLMRFGVFLTSAFYLTREYLHLLLQGSYSPLIPSFSCNSAVSGKGFASHYYFCIWAESSCMNTTSQLLPVLRIQFNFVLWWMLKSSSYLPYIPKLSPCTMIPLVETLRALRLSVPP